MTLIGRHRARSRPGQQKLIVGRRVVAETAFRRRSRPTWSKEGDRVIYAAQEFNGDIVMYDLK